MGIALVAQWIEHIPPKNGVARSIRAEGANPTTGGIMQNATIDQLTIRDFFAAVALQGMCARGEVIHDKGRAIQEETAKHA